MKNINSGRISEIEKALETRLLIPQVEYLTKGTPMNTGRATGKTFAYCVKLALQYQDTIYRDEWELCSDEQGQPWQPKYARMFFKRTFLEIREKLKNSGFAVINISDRLRPQHDIQQYFPTRVLCVASMKELRDYLLDGEFICNGNSTKIAVEYVVESDFRLHNSNIPNEFKFIPAGTKLVIAGAEFPSGHKTGCMAED